MSDVYQKYLEVATKLESHFKEELVCPEKLTELQAQLTSVQSLKPQIEHADEEVKTLGAELKTSIEIHSGSAGYVLIVLRLFYFCFHCSE